MSLFKGCYKVIRIRERMDIKKLTWLIFFLHQTGLKRAQSPSTFHNYNAQRCDYILKIESHGGVHSTLLLYMPKTSRNGRVYFISYFYLLHIYPLQTHEKQETWFSWILKATCLACTSPLKFFLTFKAFICNNVKCWSLALIAELSVHPDSLDVSGHRQDETDLGGRIMREQLLLGFGVNGFARGPRERCTCWRAKNDGKVFFIYRSWNKSETAEMLLGTSITIWVNCLENMFLKRNYDVHILNRI